MRNRRQSEAKPEPAPEASVAKSARDKAAALAGTPVGETATLPGMGDVEDEVEVEDDRRAQQQQARRATATQDPAELSMGVGYDRIVATLFDMPDPHEAYLRVKLSLRLGVKASRADYGTLVDALDEAQEMADQAYDLFVNAKVAADSYDIDAQMIESGMREQAMAALMDEYQAKKRKSPTNDDVTAWMAAQFPDEWRDVQARRGRARRMIAKLENLSQRAHERARDLRQMVASSRGN
jgi:hypothetical protein